MRVLIAFDKFKDALTAREACMFAARALQGRHPDWKIDLCPLTDGGEGFADILTHSAGGQILKLKAEGPRGGLVDAPIGWIAPEKISAAARGSLDLKKPGAIALVEMAAASGLALLAPELRDPWQTSSVGTGQLIRAAAELGAAAVLLGVGGSATHDLGLGALQSLGLEFRSSEGGKIRPPIPAAWPRIDRIEGEIYGSIPPIRIACDVANPLLGPNGAAAVYAPQKGLNPSDHDRLESLTARLAALLCEHCGASLSLAEVPGAGAAGGIAFGLMAAAGAKLVGGFDLVSSWLDLESRLGAADLVLTGEGRYDESSAQGKGPGAVAARARKLGKPVHLFAGEVRGGPDHESGIEAHCITPPGTPLIDALRSAGANLAEAVRNAL